MSSLWNPPEDEHADLEASQASPQMPEDDLGLSGVLGQADTDIPNLCDGVMARLFAANAQPIPCQYDEVFISTYLDQSLYVDFADSLLLAQRIETFESHLPHCVPCCDTLGLLTAVHDATKCWMLRQEARLEASGFTLAPKVMSALVSQSTPEQVLDESAPEPLWGCGLVSAPEASTAIDLLDEDPERVLLSNHLQVCPPCQDDFEALSQTVGHVRAYNQTHLANDDTLPNLWPGVQKQLQPSNLRWLKRPWVVASSVAAALMLVWVTNVGPTASGPNLAMAPAAINVKALEEAIQADHQDKARAERLSGVVNATYQTPESYLFNTEAEDEILQDPEATAPCDVSALVLQEP